MGGQETGGEVVEGRDAQGHAEMRDGDLITIYTLPNTRQVPGRVYVDV